MKLIVYTALFADDGLPLKEVGEFFPFKHPKDGVEYIAFTNRQDLKSDYWDVRYVMQRYSSSRLEARYHKLMPHMVLPKHDASIWLDSCCYFTYDPKSIIRKYLTDQSADIAIHRHSDITNLVQEAIAQAWVFRNDDPSIVMDQVIKYDEMGFPIMGYDHFETTIVLRVNNENTTRFNELWWSELHTHSLRDQMSAPYVVWKSRSEGITIYSIPETYVAHKYSQPLPKSKVFFTIPKPKLDEAITKRTKGYIYIRRKKKPPIL